MSQQRLIESLGKQNPMQGSEDNAPMQSTEGETPGGPGPFGDHTASDEASNQTSTAGIQDTHRSHRASGSSDKKILFLIAACNDNFIRFFNLQSIKMPLAYQSRNHNGQPLSFDISPDKQMLAVGYEDDSFITYHFEVRDHGLTIDIIPIMRGVGHRNFIQCIKFDKFFQINHLKFLQQQFDSEIGSQPFDENQALEEDPSFAINKEGQTNLRKFK